MSAIASQITSLTIVYSIVYSDADQRKHQSSASLAFVREFTGVNGQLRRKCFHLMTWSCGWAITGMLMLWLITACTTGDVCQQTINHMYGYVMMTPSKEIFSALLALCLGNSSVTGDIPPPPPPPHVNSLWRSKKKKALSRLSSSGLFDEHILNLENPISAKLSLSGMCKMTTKLPSWRLSSFNDP